jgi:hypothetical protein
MLGLNSIDALMPYKQLQITMAKYISINVHIIIQHPVAFKHSSHSILQSLMQLWDVLALETPLTLVTTACPLSARLRFAGPEKGRICTVEN